MGYRKDDKHMIYPIYFDSSVSRKDGRRIQKQLSIEKPVISDLFKIAKNLGLNPVLEDNVSHPRRHWRTEGRILVDKKDSKQSVIIQIARSL